MKQYILQKAGNLNWKTIGIYDNAEEVIQEFKNFTGIEDISSIDEMYNIMADWSFNVIEIKKYEKL